MLSSVVTFLLLAVPVLIPVATFGAYLALGNQLDAAKVGHCVQVIIVHNFVFYTGTSLHLRGVPGVGEPAGRGKGGMVSSYPVYNHVCLKDIYIPLYVSLVGVPGAGEYA